MPPARVEQVAAMCPAGDAALILRDDMMIPVTDVVISDAVM